MLKLNQSEIAQVFDEIAALLELRGENQFRIRAYLNAAHTLRNLSQDLEKLIEENRLCELGGIGNDLSEKIRTFAHTGTHPFYEELKAQTPSGLHELMRIPGLGGKKIKVLHEKLNINSLDALKEACLKGKIAELPHFGEKTQQNILQGIQHLEHYSRRQLWWKAMAIAEPLLNELRGQPGVKKAEIAGSLRRKLETVGDLDFVATSSQPGKTMNWFVTNPAVESIIAHGEAKSSIRLKGGMQSELRLVPEKQFAFTLMYSTGSKNHNIKLRQIARKKDLSLSEWGLEPVASKTKNPMASTQTITETSIYRVLGMEYIPPELREDEGEIEAAQKRKLPKLIEGKDIQGTFHVHTTASDGKATLEEMVKAAMNLDWNYLGITDHSKSSFQANGLYPEALMEQIEQIKKLNKSKKYSTHIFAGTECDILPNGKLDFENELLKQLDFVIVSIHSVLNLDRGKMTKRIIRAIENPYTTMLGHLTGRLILKREGYELDVEKVIDACIANGKIIELNAHPMRLDMDWRYWHKAADKGLMCCINPDAHTTDGLEEVYRGVNIARKGWLAKEQVLNTYSLKQVTAMLKKIRSG